MSRIITNLDRPAIDLSKRHFEGERNGIVYIGTWLNDTDHPTRSEPCLVLLHAARPVKAGRTVPIIIPLSECWRWAAHGDVGDPEHCADQIAAWLRAGYLPGDPSSLRDMLGVMDLINSRLPDLISMPPKPAGDMRNAAAIGEIRAIDRETGRVITEQEVKIHV